MNPHAEQTRKLSQALDIIESLMGGETHQGRLLALETAREHLQALWCEVESLAHHHDTDTH